MPILGGSKLELVINMQKAKVPGIDIPDTLIAGAAEVIE